MNSLPISLWALTKRWKLRKARLPRKKLVLATKVAKWAERPGLSADNIAAAIIDGTVREGDQVTVDVDKDGGFTVVCDNTPAATYEVPDAE